MRRREFLQLGAGTLLAGSTVRPADRPLGEQVPSGPSQSGAGTKLKVDAYSRHLQWLRNADEVADACAEMGFDGLNVTVRPYPGT